MRLLLDTQALIGWGLGRDRLPFEARRAIGDSSNEVFLSAVSVWEMAIKSAIGKLPLPAPAGQMCRELAEQSSFRSLQITFEHAGAVEALPPVHRDPFDRLLAAQALSEGLLIVSGDAVFDRYGVARIWG